MDELVGNLNRDLNEEKFIPSEFGPGWSLGNKSTISMRVFHQSVGRRNFHKGLVNTELSNPMRQAVGVDIDPVFVTAAVLEQRCG